MQLRHRRQRIPLPAGVLELAVDAAEVVEVLNGRGGSRQRRRLVEHLVTEEAVDALVQPLAVLQGAQQAEGLVIMDAQLAPETFGKGLVDIESLGSGQRRLQRRRRKTPASMVLQGVRVQGFVVDDIVLANLPLEPVGGKVKERRDGDVPAQTVLKDEGGGRPGGAGPLVHHAVVRLDLAAAHVTEGGSAVFPVGRLVGGFIQARRSIEDVLDAVKEGGLADTRMAGEQRARTVHVHAVPAVKGAPVDDLDLAETELAGVEFLAEGQGGCNAH